MSLETYIFSLLGGFLNMSNQLDKKKSIKHDSVDSKKMLAFSIAGLIFSCNISILGLVFSVISKRKISAYKKYVNHPNFKRIKTSTILSTVGLVVSIIFLVAEIVTGSFLTVRAGWVAPIKDFFTENWGTVKILLEGFTITLKIFFLTLIFSLPLGILVAVCKMSKIKVLQAITNIYISVTRGTPLMLQIMFFYFAPKFIYKAITGQFMENYSPFLATIIAFSLNYAAYFAEIFRGGIQSIDRGQSEASKILGFTKIQTFFRIILPQAIKKVLPATGNEVITLVKDTSLAYVVGVVEMFTLAKKRTSAEVSVVPLLIAGVIFYLFNYLVTILFNALEKKLDYYK